MNSAKTVPTNEPVETYLLGVSERRRHEAQILITLMQEISGEKPTMWGTSIIGFGTRHYKYESGHEGDMPVLSFSPRNAHLTIYFEGFDGYGEALEALGKHKVSSACLYINKLSDIKLAVLRTMLQQSYESSTNHHIKPTTVEEYISTIPERARPQFDQLRRLVKHALPSATEVLSYGIIGYTVDTKRARVYISGWNDHVALYPLPESKELQDKLSAYSKGKGTLWFSLDEPLPAELIELTVKALASSIE